jgi:hypothetical protein
MLDTSTSDGRASAAIRAPMWTAMPSTLLPISSTSPVWTPARSSNPRSPTAASAPCAQAIARAGPSNVAKKPSPVPRISLPP